MYICFVSDLARILVTKDQTLIGHITKTETCTSISFVQTNFFPGYDRHVIRLKNLTPKSMEFFAAKICLLKTKMFLGCNSLMDYGLCTCLAVLALLKLMRIMIQKNAQQHLIQENGNFR